MIGYGFIIGVFRLPDLFPRVSGENLTRKSGYVAGPGTDSGKSPQMAADHFGDGSREDTGIRPGIRCQLLLI